MKLWSVNIALPQTIEINGKPVATGINKQPVTDRVWLGRLGLTGDGQADLTVHGGEHQAVYSYPMEHYAHWQEVLQSGPLPFGTFGENFTVSGGLEEQVCVGDIWQIGAAQIQVTLPRLPCFKFGHKVGQPDILKEFLHSGRSGYYHRVLVEGMVGAGDEIKLLQRDPAGLTIRLALGMQKLGEGEAPQLRHALQIPSLAPVLRRDIEARLSADARG